MPEEVWKYEITPPILPRSVNPTVKYEPSPIAEPSDDFNYQSTCRSCGKPITLFLGYDWEWLHNGTDDWLCDAG
jgi:hypothetical protein